MVQRRKKKKNVPKTRTCKVVPFCRSSCRRVAVVVAKASYTRHRYVSSLCFCHNVYFYKHCFLFEDRDVWFEWYSSKKTDLGWYSTIAEVTGTKISSYYKFSLPLSESFSCPHERLSGISKIQLVVYYQCCVLIGWATTRLYVIAH